MAPLETISVLKVLYGTFSSMSVRSCDILTRTGFNDNALRCKMLDWSLSNNVYNDKYSIKLLP